MLTSINSENNFNDLRSELLLKEAKVINQKAEVEWTLSMISKCQDFIQTHKEALNNHLMERNILKREKNYLTGDSNDASDSDTEESLVQLDSAALKNLSQLALFSDTFEIIQVSKPDTFYRAIVDRLSRDMKFKEIYYHNQTLIPNELKYGTATRKMLLYRIDRDGEYTLSEIICNPVTMALDIHVAAGTGELISIRGEDAYTQYKMTTIGSPMSYYIMQSQTVLTKFTLLVNSSPMYLAIDICNSTGDDEVIIDAPIPKGYSLVPLTANGDYPDSFIKRNLPLKELHDQLVFIDASFVMDVNDNLVPIVITALDFKGIVLMNTVLCPRVRIKDYCQASHGLIEKDIIGKKDSNEVMKDFYKIITDKVIVGHDLKSKLKDLKVDFAYICGVRDLKDSVAMKRLLTPVTELWRLSAISDIVLHKPIPNKTLVAELNTHAIRNIYISIEQYWQDSADGNRSINAMNLGNISSGLQAGGCISGTGNVTYGAGYGTSGTGYSASGTSNIPPGIGNIKYGDANKPSGIGHNQTGNDTSGSNYTSSKLSNIISAIGNTNYGAANIHSRIGNNPLGTGNVTYGTGYTSSGSSNIPSGIGHITPGIGNNNYGVSNVPSGTGGLTAGSLYPTTNASRSTSSSLYPENSVLTRLTSGSTNFRPEVVDSSKLNTHSVYGEDIEEKYTFDFREESWKRSFSRTEVGDEMINVSRNTGGRNNVERSDIVASKWTPSGIHSIKDKTDAPGLNTYSVYSDKGFVNVSKLPASSTNVSDDRWKSGDVSRYKPESGSDSNVNIINERVTATIRRPVTEGDIYRWNQITDTNRIDLTNDQEYGGKRAAVTMYGAVGRGNDAKYVTGDDRLRSSDMYARNEERDASRMSGNVYPDNGSADRSTKNLIYSTYTGDSRDVRYEADQDNRGLPRRDYSEKETVNMSKNDPYYSTYSGKEQTIASGGNAAGLRANETTRFSYGGKTSGNVMPSVYSEYPGHDNRDILGGNNTGDNIGFGNRGNVASLRSADDGLYAGDMYPGNERVAPSRWISGNQNPAQSVNSNTTKSTVQGNLQDNFYEAKRPRY